LRKRNFFVDLFIAFAVFTSSSVHAEPDVAKCLPQGIQLSDVVEAKPDGDGGEAVTVAHKLEQLKATCSRSNKLVDGAGREIVFYRLKGCWGNPPDNYDEILAQQQKELEELKKEHTVIEMTCNPSGLAIP
jgi:hypothetical protein